MILTPPPATTPSFEKSAKPLLLALRPSRAIRVFLLLAHLSAGVAIVISAVSVLAKIALILLVIASFYYHISQSGKTVQLVWRTGNRWFIDDAQHASQLSAINFYSRWLVIVSLKPGADPMKPNRPSNKRRVQKFLIPFDSLNADTFRLLRVRLRIEGFEALNPQDESIK